MGWQGGGSVKGVNSRFPESGEYKEIYTCVCVTGWVDTKGSIQYQITDSFTNFRYRDGRPYTTVRPGRNSYVVVDQAAGKIYVYADSRKAATITFTWTGDSGDSGDTDDNNQYYQPPEWEYKSVDNYISKPELITSLIPTYEYASNFSREEEEVGTVGFTLVVAPSFSVLNQGGTAMLEKVFYATEPFGETIPQSAKQIYPNLKLDNDENKNILNKITATNTGYSVKFTEGEEAPSKIYVKAFYKTVNQTIEDSSNYLTTTIYHYVSAEKSIDLSLPTPPTRLEIKCNGVSNKLILGEPWSFSWSPVTDSNTGLQINDYAIEFYNCDIPITSADDTDWRCIFGSDASHTDFSNESKKFTISLTSDTQKYIQSLANLPSNYIGHGFGFRVAALYVYTDEYGNVSICRGPWSALSAAPLASSNQIFIKTASGWKEGQVYVKTSNDWKEAEAVYVKTATGWKESQ